ncbi:Elongation factor P--(R)-beta-lysine ligase [Buchnera aphidicola (Eriosoma grossulariae)]|uniref:elongation factor P--(R)-beta-lysine ligase n=1 Tax=Buchnera aphidicola TaxID=9 RepID=UPI0034647903
MENKLYDWKPTAKISNLVNRSRIMTKIRSFFLNLGILEIETPVLSKFRVTDIHLESFKTYFKKTEKKNKCLKFWLNTSPEYYMKRLIAANIGAIYQICHSFRNGEIGRYHHPEFTMLEWYRPLYNMHDLMNEVELFLKTMFDVDTVKKISYQDVFIKYLDCDPFSSNHTILLEKVKNLGVENLVLLNKHGQYEISSLLEILFVFGVEPNIGQSYPTIIYHYPASQNSNAIVNINDSRLVDRFEIFFKGIELGNGCHELTDICIQKKRFLKDNSVRLNYNLTVEPIDTIFLESLTNQINYYSGVAIGLDRLIMIILKLNSIRDVISFSLDSCINSEYV